MHVQLYTCTAILYHINVTIKSCTYIFSYLDQSKMSDKILGSLCAHFELADQDLDKEISDLHLDEIARTRDINWKSLPSRLGLQDVVAKDIDKNFTKEFDKRQGFFQLWKRIKGYEATYRSLVKALLDINQRHEAEYVCELLRPILADSSNSSGMQKIFTEIW